MSKAELHKLVDELPEEQEEEAQLILQRLCDGRAAMEYTSDTAPFDDEPLSAEDIAALVEAEEDVAAGREVTHEEAKLRLLGGE